MAHICESFPCHEWKDGMDCKYCYCPIYEKDCEKFGGNPIFIENVKDCSECVLPHKENFEEILTEINENVIIKE